MRMHVLTTVILAFADCLLCSESQETEHGPSQQLSPNAPLSSTPVKAVASQTSLSQATNGNSSSPEGAVRYLSPFKVLRRRRPLYADANHTFPVVAVSRSYSPGLPDPIEERSNNSKSTDTPQNPSSPISKMTLHYYDGSVETHPFRPISTVPQSSPTISMAASNFLPLPRTTHLSLPVSSITKPSALDSYTKSSSPRASGETDLFSPAPSATRDSGTGSRETFSSPPDSGAMNFSAPTSNTTHLSMPTFRTRYRFTPAFTTRYHSVPDSPATQNASHDSHSFPTKHVQRQSLSSLDQTGFKEMTSLPLSHWLVPSQSLSKVPMMPGTTKQTATNPESSLKPVIRHSLPTVKGSRQSSFVPDSENYSSSFSILSGHSRSTLAKRNSFNVDQDKSSHSSTAPTGVLLVKDARQSLPLFSGPGNLPRTKVVWNKSRELKPYPLIPYNSFGKDKYLLANGRTDASQSPWNTPTAPLYPQANPSSSMFGYPPLSHFPSISEAPISTTTDTIIRILDSNTPISSVNTNNETPRLKSQGEEATTNVVDFTTVGGNEEITAIADATPWDKKANTTAYHATGYFLDPENLADDFLKDSNNALTGVHNSSDDSTYKEERERDGMDLDSAAPSMEEDNTIVVDNTDVLEEDFRALMNTLEFVGEDGFTMIYVPEWEEGYLTDDDDPVVLKEDGIDEVNTRSFTKGISKTKFPVGNNDAAIPMKNVIPFTTSREIPEDVAVPTSSTVSKDVATNAIDEATNFFPKMFVRKSSTPVVNKHLDFTTVAENSMPTGDPVTSEVNDILSVRDSEIPIQQIILTQFKPQISLPENELNATGNAHTVLLENTTVPDKIVTVYMTQLWGDNSVIENYTTFPETNTTLSKRMPSLTNMPTRPIPDAAISMVGTANPLLNNPNATPTKEAIIKASYTITNMEDDSTMGKGQQTLSGRVIPRSSTIIPRKGIKVTLYGLPRMNETFSDGDTVFKGDVSLFPKAGTAVEADKVILADENTPNDNTLGTFIMDDNDPKSTKDDSFLPQVNTAKHLVDKTKHATNSTQSDPRVAISTVHISPSMSDRTVTTLRKVYSTGSDDVIPFMEENPESEIKAPVFHMLRDAPNSRDVTSRSMGGGRTKNWAKTSKEEDTATENKLKPTEEHYGGFEKAIVSKVLPTSFAFGSDNDAFDVDDSDTKGFYSFQKGYGMIIFPLGDRATIPMGSHSSLTQGLDSKVDPTPLLYEMTDSDPNVPLISSMKNLKPIPTRNMADVTTDGIEEIILKDKETATIKQNEEEAEDARFFQPVNSIPGIRRKDYSALSDTDYDPAVRQTTILLDDNIKPAVISTPLWSKTPVSTIMEVKIDSTIKPAEKAPPKDDSNLTMNYINAKHDSTMEVADPAKPILLTANTFKTDVSSAKLQETFHEKDPFPHAIRQPSELSAKNLAKIKDAALPEWQITESHHHNVLPSETVFFPAALTTPMIEPISSKQKTTSTVNGNRASQNGGVSEVRRDGKNTILERTRRITDTKPVMDSTPLTYGPDGFEAPAPNSLSRIIILPSNVGVTENHHTIFTGKDKYNTEADRSNLMRDPANLKAVNTRTTNDSNFSQTESSTLASLDMEAMAANDMDFLPDKSNPRVEKILHSSAPDSILDRTNTNPYITDSTESNRKDKLPLVKNDYRPATYDAVGLQAVTTTTAAEPRTQEDETNTTGPKLINFPLKMDPVTSFTDSVIDELLYERKDAPTDLVTTGAMTQADRVTLSVANGTTLPRKDNNAEGWFIIPRIDTALSRGGAPLVTPETLSLLPDVTADDTQLSVFTEEDPLTDASIIVASEVSEPMVENIETTNEAANPGGQIFESQRDHWAVPWEKRLLIADPTSSGPFSRNFEDSASTTGNRVAITEMDSSDAPLMTPETLSLLPDVTTDDAQLSVFTEEDPLTDASIIVASEVSEPMVENIETINEAANLGGQIFESQWDPLPLPLESIVLPADSPTSRFSPTSSEHSSLTMATTISMPVKDIPSSTDGPRDNSERLVLETVPSEESSSTGGETVAKEEIVTQAERNPPYGMAYNDFVSGNAINRTGVSFTNSVLIPTDIKMAVDRESGALRRERAAIESNGIKSPTDKTNSKTVATGNLMKTIPDVREIAFVEEKGREADKIAVSFLPDMRGLGNIRSYDALPVGGTKPSATDSTTSGTMPSRETPASSESATGPMDHTSGAPAIVTDATIKTHAKEDGTAAAEITNSKNDVLPVTPTSIPAAEGTSHVDDGTEIVTNWVTVATEPSAYTEYTETGQNQAISEGNPSLSTGYDNQLSTKHLTLPSVQLHTVVPKKEASVGNVIRTPTERRNIEAENPSTTNNPNSPDTPIVAVTTTFQNTDTTVLFSGPEYDILTEEDSSHEPEGGEEEEGDNDILEVTNITPFLSHDSILQRDNLSPKGYLINSEEDTVVTLDPNGFLTHMGYSIAKATNSEPETAASEFEEIVILEKDGLVDTDTDFFLPDIPEGKRNAVHDDPITQERVKTPKVSSRDLLLASTKTEAFPSKDRDSLDNKIAHGEDPNEMKKRQEAVADSVTFFSTPEMDSSDTNTEPLMGVTTTRGFVPMKRGIPDLSKATTLHSGYLKPQNNSTTTISEADSTLVSTGDTTLLTDHPLNFDPDATGIFPETFHLKESSLDVATVLEASGPASERPLPVNGAPAPEWNVISAQSDPQALQLESTLPPLPRIPAHTDTDTVGTVKEDPITEIATFDEKDLSPKRAISAAAPSNWREDTDFRIRSTPYEADIPVEEMASDEYEKAFHREEEDTIAERDDIAKEGENTPHSTYSSPFMSGNNIPEGKKLDPEDGSVFYEANSNSVITDAINSPPQIIINEETKVGDSISHRDEKPSTIGDSAAETTDDNMKTITADGIPDRMIKMPIQFKGIISTGQNYSEGENSSIFLPDIAYLPVKRKAQKDGEFGPDVDSPLASKDTRLPVAGITGPVPFATLLEGKVSSTLVPGEHATNNVAGAKSPEQETKTAMVEMFDPQNDISPVISFIAPAEVRVPYANIGYKYRKDLAANSAIPLTWKAPAIVAKDAMLPSEYIQPNSESTAPEVGTTMSTGGGPLTALINPIHEHFASSDKSQINHHGRDRTPITFETLEPGADNSHSNDAATMGQPLTKMKADLPSLPLVPTPLPDDSSMSIDKAIYTRHTEATARKDARTSMVPDILSTLINVPRADIKDRINTSSYQPDIIIEEYSSMEYDEIPFVEEDTSGEGDVIYLEEENTSNDDLMTIVLDNNVSAYVTEDNIIAPPGPIINTPTLTYEPSELGTYASYNKADSSYSSSEIASAEPTQTNSTETSHTIIPEYEPFDSEIYTTMLKSVAPRTIAYTSSDGSKKMSSRFLKMTIKEQNNKVVDDATTFLPATSNSKKKRIDSSVALDLDTGLPIEESETSTMDNFGSAGEPAPIKNKEVFDTKNIAADASTSGRNPSVTAVEEQYFKTVGSEIATSWDSTSHSELLMSPEINRISHVDENMEMVTDMIDTANMPAAGKVASVGVLPVQDSDSPVPKADVTIFLNNKPLLTHENPSLTPSAKTDSAAAPLQQKNEALLDDFFLVSEETEIGVEQLETSKEDDTSVPEITLLNKDVSPLVSEDNVIQAEESLSYDTDSIGGDNSNSEDNYIILEPNVSDLNVVMNSCPTNTNGLETIACTDSITITEKSGEDEFYAKNLPADKAKVPMETMTMTDVITDGIKTTPQEITAVEEGNRAAVKVTSSEPDMPHSETIVNIHKGSYIASDWDPVFTTTDTSPFTTGSTDLAEDITSLKNQETSIPKDTRFSTYNTIDPKAEPMVTTTDATSEEKEENEVAEITKLENNVTPMSSFISHKTEDIEPVTNLGIADAITAEEETPTPMFSASTIYTGYNKHEYDLVASGANSAPVSIGDTNLLKDATMVNSQETLPSKEMSLDGADMTVSEVTGPVSEKPLLVNGAPNLEWTVINAQSDPQALQLESTLPPLPRTPAYTDADTVGTVNEDPVTETATSGEKDPSHKRAMSAAATINLREDTDFISKTTRYEADISLGEITPDKHEVAFHGEEENAIAKDGVTQEENTLYTTDFSTYISSRNILKDNELDPQDYSIFPKREGVGSISKVNKITADLSKFAAQPTSPQNRIPIITSFSVPEADRISFRNKDSEALSYSDLTGDMSFTAEANPTITKVQIPTSLPNRSVDDFLVSRSGTAKCSEHTPPSMDTTSILEGEFTSKKVQDTLLAKDGSLPDLKMTKSHLLNPVTDHSAPVNNLGILEGSITKTLTHLHAFPLDAARENTVSSVDSTYTEYAPSTTREDTTSEMSFGVIRTSPGSSSLEEMFPVTSAAELVPEDPPPKIDSPNPTTDITGNITEETIFSMGDATPKVQTAITSEGGYLISLDDSTPEQSDIIATAVNFMSTFTDFISSVADKLTVSKQIPTSEFNTKFHHTERHTVDDVAEDVSALTHTAMLSDDATPLTEEEVISYETGSISPISNDDEAIDPANEVSDFMMKDPEEGKITEFVRIVPSEEDDPNAMATVNGFIQKSGIIEEKDTLSVAHLTDLEEEDITTSETSNSIEVDSLDDNGLWMEGNPDDELSATALVLEASKTKDHSALSASEAKNTGEEKSTMRTFLTKLVAVPSDSVTTATAALPGGPNAGRPTELGGACTTKTAISNLKEEGFRDSL